MLEERSMTDIAKLERNTLATIRTFNVRIAWPTILLTIALLVAYCGVVTAAFAGVIPLWLALICNSFIAYLSYTPTHEVAHSNVARNGHPWINRLVGNVGASLLLHNFSMHRITHLSHHAHLNDPKKDADHWVAGRSWLSILMRCTTLVFSHYLMGIRFADRRIILVALIENMLPLLALLSVGILGGWDIALFAMVIPAFIGATLLGLLFDYAVHAPYEGSGRFGATRMFLFPLGFRRIGSALWMAQNYHLIHHLYPWLPFYRYAAGYRTAQPLLVARGAHIVRIGH